MLHRIIPPAGYPRTEYSLPLSTAAASPSIQEAGGRSLEASRGKTHGESLILNYTSAYLMARYVIPMPEGVHGSEPYTVLNDVIRSKLPLQCGFLMIFFHSRANQITVIGDLFTELSRFWVHRHETDQGRRSETFACLTLFVKFRKHLKLLRTTRLMPDGILPPQPSKEGSRFMIYDYMHAVRTVM